MTSQDGDVSKFDVSQINNKTDMKMLDVNNLELEFQNDIEESKI